MAQLKTKFLLDNAVTYAKMQQAAASTLIGNSTGSTANIAGITLGSGLSFSGTTLTATGTNPVGNVSANDSNVVFTNSDNRIQICTPTAARTYTLPTTSIVAGDVWTFYNQATSAANYITIQSSGSNAICIVPPLGRVILYTAVATPTTAANWIFAERQSQWVSYTPTFGTGFGTVTGVAATFRLIGDTLEVGGYFVTGTVAANVATVTMPSFATISSSKYPNATTAYNSTSIVGEYGAGITALAGTLIAYPSTSTSLLYFAGNYASSDSNNSGSTYGNAIFSSSAPTGFKFRVAITL